MFKVKKKLSKVITLAKRCRCYVMDSMKVLLVNGECLPAGGKGELM